MDEIEDASIIDFSEKEWLIISLRLVFSNPSLSPDILSKALGINLETAIEIMSHFKATPLLNLDDDQDDNGVNSAS